MSNPRNATAEIGQRRKYTFRGATYPSVTSILSLGRPQEWMGAWAAKEVAMLAVSDLMDAAGKLGGTTLHEWERLDRELHEATKTHQERHRNSCPYEPSALGYLKAAPWRKRDTAAEHGTNVHEIFEALSMGEVLPADAPPQIAEWRDAYRPRFEETEFQVVNTKHGYAGSGDLIATIYGRRLLIDLKTSKLYDGSHKRKAPSRNWSLQLAAYRNAESIFIDDDAWAMPPVDDCAVLWIPSDAPEEWSFFTMPANGSEFAAFLAAKQTHDDHIAHAKETGASIILPQTLSVDEVSLRPKLRVVS